MALSRAAGTRPWNDPHRDIARTATTRPEPFPVGTIDDAIVATAMVGYDGHRRWVDHLAVDEVRRRRARARRPMHETERLLPGLGCPRLDLQLGATPLVSGSADFSKASCETNDENTIVVHGDRRGADIYFCEYLRLCNHDARSAKRSGATSRSTSGGPRHGDTAMPDRRRSVDGRLFRCRGSERPLPAVRVLGIDGDLNDEPRRLHEWQR